ncbi:hypothetical protein V6N13_118869 [Hibiscus sabdariffa]
MTGAEQNSESSGMSAYQSSALALVDSSSNHVGFCGNSVDENERENADGTGAVPLDFESYREIVLKGHLRALAYRLLLLEYIPVEDDDEKKKWFDIILSLTAGSRSDDDDCSDSESKHYAHAEEYYGATDSDDEFDRVYGSDEVHSHAEVKSLSGSPLYKNFVIPSVDEIKEFGPKNEPENADGGEAPVPVDFESNRLLFHPPEFGDDGLGLIGEWGFLHSNSSRDKYVEDCRRAMKNAVQGHLRALVSQLLQIENVPVGEENWLDIIVSLSWEAATLLKSDTSKGGGMDPGEYVKVKCIAAGHRSQR